MPKPAASTLPTPPTVPLYLGGEWVDGDAGLIPDGYTRNMVNMVYRSGVWVKRPPLSKDGGTTFSTFSGYTMWDDVTNQALRLVAFNLNGGANTDIYIKGTSGDTYGGAVSGTTGPGSPSSYTNYKGIMYYTMASGTPAVPTGLFSYDGTSVKANPLGGETLYSLCIQSFIDRIFLGYVKATVTNQLGTSIMYDSTAWTANTATGENITNGSTVTSRVTPTAVTGSQIYKKDVYTVAASTSNTNLIFRSDLRGVSPTDEMPLTTQIFYSQIWVSGATYAVGAIRVPTAALGNGFRYRVKSITTGIAAVGEPAWPTTVGTTVVDGGVTWVCDGPDSVGEARFSLPTISDQPNFSPYFASASIPPMPQSAKVGVRIKFGNVDTPTITLNPIDISLKDGLTDGVLNKRNFGQQLTVGLFYYPFVNTESTASAAVDLTDDLYWSETADPNTVRGANTYRLREAPGRVRAMAVVGNRLIVFKQRGMWVFQGTADPDNPIVRERYFGNFGCAGPRTWAVFEDTLYFVSEQEVYSYVPGGVPQPLLGNALRQSFVTGQLGAIYSTGAAVAVDAINRDLYVPGFQYWYTYNLDTKAWSQHNSGAALTLEHPSFLIWNPTTSQMYGKTDAAAYPFLMSMFGAAANDSYGSQTTGTASITFRPLGSVVGRRYISLDMIGAWVGASSGENVTVSVTDEYLTAKTNTVTPFNTPAALGFSPNRVPIPIRHAGVNHSITISHTGKFGDIAFQITRAEAIYRDLGPERIRAIPTNVSNTL